MTPRTLLVSRRLGGASYGNAVVRYLSAGTLNTNAPDPASQKAVQRMAGNRIPPSL